MVGRILGPLPCLAEIPAALELQSSWLAYAAVSELLLGRCIVTQGPPMLAAVSHPSISAAS